MVNKIELSVLIRGNIVLNLLNVYKLVLLLLSCIAEGCVEDPVLLYPCGLQGLPSLQVLVPSLLRHEIEKALEKLDVIWDRTYAWEMFLDMMVRHH